MTHILSQSFSWAWRNRAGSVKFWAMYRSGCGRSAGPTGLATEIRVEEFESSKVGVKLATATGHLEVAQGRRRLTGGMQDGRQTSFNFEAAGVNKSLLTASELAAHRYKRWLDNDYGLLYGSSGAPIYMPVRAGV